jgi:hypothetical protein
MPEVREQAAHAATLRVQCREISERICFFRIGVYVGRLRLHATFLRLPLAGLVAQTSVCGVWYL